MTSSFLVEADISDKSCSAHCLYHLVYTQDSDTKMKITITFKKPKASEFE